MTSRMLRCCLALSILLLAACEGDTGPRNDEAIHITVAEINADPEALVGQLVAIDGPMTIAGNYHMASHSRLVAVSGERWFTPTQIVAPGDDAMAQLQRDQARSLILQADFMPLRDFGFVDADVERLAGVRGGRQLDGLVGILEISDWGPVLRLTEEPGFDFSPRPQAPSFAPGAMKIAAFNVLNYFNGDGQGRGFPTERGAETLDGFLMQRDKLFAAMLAMDADLIALSEVENNGFGPGSAIQDLVDGINALLPPSQHYRAVTIEPQRLGSDAITVGMLYRPAVVSPLGQPATLTDGPYSINNRPPLAASFTHRESGQPFTLVANHLKAKSGCQRAEGADTDQGDGQGCFNAVRTQAAQLQLDWLQTHPTGIDAPLIVAGDLNAYAQEDPLQVFYRAGFARAMDLAGRGPGYSYVFRARSGSLDHILVGPGLQEQLLDAQSWPINADESRALEYDQALNTPLETDPATPWRSSDHDPLIAAFGFSGQ